MNIERITELLTEAEVEYTLSQGNAVVTLPGEKRLKTNCLFIPEHQGVRVEAFVCRHIEEAHDQVYAMLLKLNQRIFGVHYTLDNSGDIYLVANLSESVTPDDIQMLLGQVLQRADGDFNKILELGFETSIRKEWEWRLKNGESTRNLAAFEHLRPSDS